MVRLATAAQSCAIALATLSSLASAVPFYTLNTAFETTPLEARDIKEKDFTLRVLPLGASITVGYLSSDNNGYRKALREQLRYAGWPVNMVGSLQVGNMTDNDNEGHSGYRVDEIAQEAEKSIPFQPNLILINAGTNDAVQKHNTSTTGERMDALIARLYEAIPGTTIILSTLLPNKLQPDIINDINDQYRKIYTRRHNNNDKIVLADMPTFITKDDLNDDTHPTDAGYVKMASVWWAAINEADSNGLLTPPKDTGINDTLHTTCEKKYGSGASEYAQTQRGSGFDDGDYEHNAEYMGRIFEMGKSAGDDVASGLHFAQLVNTTGAYREGALDELVWTKDGDETYMFLNEGDGKFGNGYQIDVKDKCLARGVRWGDLNNDGYDDFICIARNGAMYVSMHRGVMDGIPTFESIGLVRGAPGDDLGQENVRLGDIDGDGRVDYCLIHGNGDIRCWRNGGQGDAPTTKNNGYWQDLGIVFTGKGMGDISGVQLIDINGDFRSDWLWMDDTGKVTTYINNRGTGKGSLVPDWRSVGVTHAGMNVKGAKDNIKFGQVYAGNGADYVWFETVEAAGGDGETDDHYAHAWKNTGKGGAHLKGDGVYYCDMRGTGADDYIWVSPTGTGYLYGNVHKPPVWSPEGQQIFEANADRKAVHLADFDGDGKCDLWVTDRTTGSAEVWINQYDLASETMKWNPIGSVTGNASCTQGWSVGLYDIGLAFHDIDGDGRADYLCMEPNGTTTAFLNQGVKDFKDMGQIKRSQGYDRANHRWADVNGDGRADFLWIDKFSGNVTVWNNDGKLPDGKLAAGSTFKWTQLKGPRYAGVDRGANLHFANLGGLGRADLVQVIPRTNLAYTWFNTCPGGMDDQDPSINPKLPVYTRQKGN
ncbi:hypothetical protein ASPWEDRAFT_41117 [Aspergillus wentii DTO 134E9]|uniref:SGNH hydrolase-type esterase domain-containing protein n=1 Tax=Aspergillus wentii DTO 134E9 TaxID=1073089 RepID=A0A1L9RM26_ASPWE|nr:uncharacterized protein ASPWEDRAFT_41117 [Aspergillus wentii DTO 134E9]OJJ35887.1 hypothetical protein ASPWEDRAFT_41117 [Aspergillus wentii DTO 134E9]